MPWCQKHTHSEERPYKGRQGSRYFTRKTQQVSILQSNDNLLSTLCSVITRSSLSQLLQFGSDYPFFFQIVAITYFGKKLL